MFGYSLTRPVHNQDYYYNVLNTCHEFNCAIEGWHTESGPGVFEAVWLLCEPSPELKLTESIQALEYGEIKQMADKASLFKWVIPRGKV